MTEPLEPVSVQPGLRTLLPTDMFRIPAQVADPLLALGRACNDAGAALASASLDGHRVNDAKQRQEQAGDAATAIEVQLTELLWEAGTDHIDRLSEIYASIAARYVGVAVETASQAISGRTITVPAAADIEVTDILLLAEIHVPLIQLVPAAYRDPTRQRRARRENAGILASHRTLLAIMASTIKEEFDTSDGTRRFWLQPELGGALHEYARVRSRPRNRPQWRQAQPQRVMTVDRGPLRHRRRHCAASIRPWKHGLFGVVILPRIVVWLVSFDVLAAVLWGVWLRSCRPGQASEGAFL